MPSKAANFLSLANKPVPRARHWVDAGQAFDGELKPLCRSTVPDPCDTY